MPLFLKYTLTNIYVLFILFTIARILLDKQSTSKALGYILLVIIVPLAGSVFYYSFGINYRHLASTKKVADKLNDFTKVFRQHIPDETNKILETNAAAFGQYTELARFIH
jgi:cardiolipin synthase